MTRLPLTIMIPAYNEAKRLGATLDALHLYLEQQGMLETTEVLISLGVSPDDTEMVAASHGSVFPHFETIVTHHRGKGDGVMHGMLSAHGEKILFMDADLATPLEHIPEMLASAKTADIVIGVRDVTSTHKGFVRKLLSFGGNVLVQTLILPGIPDTQCGFKLFSREAAQKIFNRLTIYGWTFDMEALALGRKIFHYKIATVDIPDWRDVAGGTLAPSAGAAVASLLDLFKIRINLWLGKYGRV